MRYTFIKSNGETMDMGRSKKVPPLHHLQALVGGTIDIVPFPNGDKLYVNDNGKLDDLPVNIAASKLFQKAFPIEEYPNNNDGIIVGDVR